MKIDIEEILKSAGVAVTPVRIMVYKCLLSSSCPLSLSDIEIELDSVDKSTVSRTLNTFRRHHLIHSFNDGSGSMKYEVCKSTCEDEDDDTHVHFRCEKCGSTFCFPSISIPAVDLPQGYLTHEVSYIISGICPDCSR